ncbi:MAG: glyoxalase superfamily protein [Hyphomicrobiaceae bacterium]
MNKLMAPTPILRIFDITKARAFYLDYLGFSVDWEHRFSEKSPLYFSVTRDACTLHLTEHHGDCCPGAAMRIPVDDVRAIHTEIIGKNYDYLAPGLETQPWNTLELSVKDPFHNRLTFFETMPNGKDENETISV